MICKFCGREFEPKYHTQKYCDACRHRYDAFLFDKVRKGSWQSYFSFLINFEKWLTERGKSFDNVQKEDMQKYIRELEGNGAEASSINTFISVMQSYAGWVISNSKSKWINEGGLERMFIEMERWEKIKNIKRPLVEEAIRGEAFLTIEQLKKYLSIASFDDFCLIWVLAWFGCRPGELRRAERKGKIVTMVSEKTGGKTIKRRVAVDAFTMKIFDYAKKRKLLKLSRQAIEFRLKGGEDAIYDKTMGIHVMPKMLRHTFATYMDALIGDKDIEEKFGRKLDDKIIKIWMGHKVKGMKDITQVYREYPDELLIYIAEHKHYMRKLEPKFKERIER